MVDIRDISFFDYVSTTIARANFIGVFCFNVPYIVLIVHPRPSLSSSSKIPIICRKVPLRLEIKSQNSSSAKASSFGLSAPFL